MAKEVERKYLVIGNSFREASVASHEVTQWYLSRTPESTVRIRIIDDKAFLTIKGITHGFTRSEWEYEIPIADANEMLSINPTGLIHKTRHIVPYGNRTWEVDEFHNILSPADRSKKLIMAEIELDRENEIFELPPFVGPEVTGDSRYYNSQLISSADK